jgi:peroxiredoxin
MTSLEAMTATAEAEWLARWTSGPTESKGSVLARGAAAPDLVLPDHTGRDRSLSDFWAGRSALVMFWRHFGCSCGVERARRLVAEYVAYQEAGLSPVIVAQGEPDRAAAYRKEHGLPCPILCDPEHVAYRAYGLGHWSVEQVLYDAPAEYWRHEHDLGARFQDGRRREGRPPVDDPWRATAEFVIGPDGDVRLPYAYQFCEDFPDVRVLVAAARLSQEAAGVARA